MEKPRGSFRMIAKYFYLFELRSIMNEASTIRPKIDGGNACRPRCTSSSGSLKQLQLSYEKFSVHVRCTRSLYLSARHQSAIQQGEQGIRAKFRSLPRRSFPSSTDPPPPRSPADRSLENRGKTVPRQLNREDR